MDKEKDILNPCGHRNSERVKALKKLPSSICPACLLERIKELEAALEELRLDINRKADEHWIAGYEIGKEEAKQALKGE